MIAGYECVGDTGTFVLGGKERERTRGKRKQKRVCRGDTLMVSKNLAAFQGCCAESS